MEMDDSQVNMMLLFIFVVTKTDSSLISLMWKNRKNRKKKTNKKNNCILQCDFFCIIDLRWTSGTHYFFLGVSKASPKRSSLQFFTQYLHTNITYRIKTLGYFFSSSFSENSCCLLAGEAHGLSFSVLSSVLCLFSFLPCFLFLSFFFFFLLLPFCICPLSMKPKSMRTRGIRVPAGVRRSDPLWVSHVALVKWGLDLKSHTHIHTHTHINVCSYVYLVSQLWCCFVTFYFLTTFFHLFLFSTSFYEILFILKSDHANSLFIQNEYTALTFAHVNIFPKKNSTPTTSIFFSSSSSCTWYISVLLWLSKYLSGRDI